MNTQNTTKYNLTAQPPHLMVPVGEWQCRVMLSGESYLILAGGVLMPIACPVPTDTLLGAQFAAWLVRNHRWWPAVFVGIAALVSLQLALMWADGGGEFYAASVQAFSYAMNVTLAVLFLLCVASIAVYYFVTGSLKRKQEEAASLLTAGEISITPDILVMAESADEKPADFIRRTEAARMAQKPGQWVVVFAFQHPSGVIIMNPEPDEEVRETVFYRARPPYETNEWPAEQRTTNMVRFNGETYDEYVEYIRRFVTHYPEWAKQEKLKMAQPTEALINTLKIKQP